MIAWPAKDPAEVLDFSWIVPIDAGDTVSGHTATIISGSAVKDSSALDTATVRVWLSGGTADELTYINLTATTTGGRTFREVAVLPVIDRASLLLAQFRIRYPAFSAVDDGQIGYWMADAANVIGTEWGDSADAARVIWAAHKLSETGALTGAVPAGLTSFKSGTFSATVSDGIASLTGLSATSYGREFLAMRKALFSGPFMAWTPPVADCA